MIRLKKKIIFILKKISSIIYYLVPEQFKNRPEKLLKLKLNQDLANETFSYFKENFKDSVIFEELGRKKIREYAIKNALLNDKNKEYHFLEFGVYQGKSANYFSKFVNKLYCFDSFEGLREDYVGTPLPQGSFNLNKKIPNLNTNVEPIIGWAEDTLDHFLKKHNPKINFIHFDMDNYVPTKFVLKKIKPYLVKNSILIFDELYNYPGWKNGEFKALKEEFKEDDFKYKAFNLYGKQCVIQIK